MPKKLTDQERLLRAITEKEHQKSVTDLATLYGWRYVHFSDSRAVNKRGQAFGDKQTAGWPDVTAAHKKHGLVFMEMKKELGVLAESQVEWLDLLLATGSPAFVSRPSNFDQVAHWLMYGFPSDIEVYRGIR